MYHFHISHVTTHRSSILSFWCCRTRPIVGKTQSFKVAKKRKRLIISEIHFKTQRRTERGDGGSGKGVCVWCLLEFRRFGPFCHSKAYIHIHISTPHVDRPKRHHAGFNQVKSFHLKLDWLPRCTLSPACSVNVNSRAKSFLLCVTFLCCFEFEMIKLFNSLHTFLGEMRLTTLLWNWKVTSKLSSVRLANFIPTCARP